MCLSLSLSLCVCVCVCVHAVAIKELVALVQDPSDTDALHDEASTLCRCVRARACERVCVCVCVCVCVWRVLE